MRRPLSITSRQCVSCDEEKWCQLFPFLSHNYKWRDLGSWVTWQLKAFWFLFPQLNFHRHIFEHGAALITLELCLCYVLVFHGVRRLMLGLSLNNELESVCQKAVATKFKLLSKHFPRGIDYGARSQKNVVSATPAVNSEAYKTFSVPGYWNWLCNL